jgi:hypothetical protein
MKIYTAQSTNPNPKEAVLELKGKFTANNIKVISFFASTIYDPTDLIAAMNENFPNIEVLGCSTCGEIISGSMATNSIVAMAFTDEIIEDIKVEIIDNTNIDAKSAISSFENYYSAPITELDNKKYVGLLFFNGLAMKEELILDQLGDHSNIFLIGGSAADDLSYSKAVTYANGKHYTNSAIFTLIKSKVGIGFEKMQSFVLTDHIFTATKVDETTRTIHELDGRPAVEVYCELVNVPVTEMQNTFSNHALAFMIDDQPFMRALQYRGNDIMLGVGCSIKEGMHLTIAKNSDIIADTKKGLDDIKKKYKSISAALSFDCGYRFIELMRINKTAEYANLFTDFPVVGFCTYGETYIGHLNQTLVMLIFE